MGYDYKLLIEKVGCQGRISDRRVFRNSAFNLALSNINLPDAKPLPASNDPLCVPTGETKKMPMLLVADDAFPLIKDCMKPYGCSRFQRISENSFGI